LVRAAVSMRIAPLLLLTAGLVLVALPTTDAQSGSTTFNLVGKPNGSSFAWYQDGAGSPNPTLTVPASTQITFTLSSADSTPHTFEVGSTVLVKDAFDSTAGPQTATWTSGTSDTTYSCTIHPDMKGTIHIAGTSASPTKASPSTQVVGVAMALMGAALLLRRK
jgi:heme/copper-type cytochrome/quinol oxidase subunit 2